MTDSRTFASMLDQQAAQIVLLQRAVSEKDSEISRLQAELDGMRDVPVEYVTSAGLAAAMAVDPGREDGSVLRCTDGERKAYAWSAVTREWAPA